MRALYTRIRWILTTVLVVTLAGFLTPATVSASSHSQTHKVSLAESVREIARTKGWSQAQADALLASTTNQVRAAARTKGLSSAQVDALLSDVAKLGTATTTEVGHTESAGNSQVASNAVGTAVPFTNFGPAKLHEWITYKNFLGMSLATMDAAKEWWGDKICCVTIAPNGVFSAKISGLGAITGWEWHGFIYNENFYYPYTGHSNPHAGHASEAEGSFSFCPPRVICLQWKFPTERQHGHFDLTGVQNLNT